MTVNDWISDGFQHSFGVKILVKFFIGIPASSNRISKFHYRFVLIEQFFFLVWGSFLNEFFFVVVVKT